MKGAPFQHSVLWHEAFNNDGHLCNGLCPDISEPGPDSRDPACFYCSVLSLEEQLEAAQEKFAAARNALIFIADGGYGDASMKARAAVALFDYGEESSPAKERS